MSEQTKDIKDLDLLQNLSDNDRILMTKASEGHAAKVITFASLKENVLGSMEKPITSINKEMVEKVLTGNITSHSHTFANITGKPTTLAGYGITDAAKLNHTHNYAGSSTAGGSATSALQLATARTINGTSFNGTGNITTANWGTARTFALSGAVTGSVSVNGGSNITLATALSTELVKDTLKNTYKSLDLRSLNADTWYPCTIPVSTSKRIKIIFKNALAGNKPAWATHASGFSMYLEWDVNGSGWGGTAIDRAIYGYSYSFAPVSPCGGITQNVMASMEIIWLRGGGLYYYWTDNNSNFTIYTSGYSWASGTYTYSAPTRTSSQITDPRNERSGNISAGSFVGALSGNAASATKLESHRTLWGQAFNGTGNVSGAITGATTGSFSDSVSVGGILTSGDHTINGSAYNMLTLKRIATTGGSSILFSNTSVNLGKIGFTSVGDLVISKGNTTNGMSDLLHITAAGTTTIYGSILPNTNNTRNLGIASQRWASIYTQLLNAAGAATLSSTLTVGSSITAGGPITNNSNTSMAFSWANALVNGVIRNNSIIGVNAGSVRPIITWADTLSGAGYNTRYSIGSYRSAASFGELTLRVGNNDAGTSGVTLGLRANGSGVWSGTGTFAFAGGISSVSLGVNSRLNIDTTGRITPTSTATRRAGMYGVYDSTKIGHIWSMGTAYMIPDNGANFGNLYGLAYKHTNNSTGGTMAGGHQMVWCSNGGPRAALGENGIWSWSNIVAMGNITAGGNIIATGEITAYSDIRLKSDIKPLKNRGYLNPVTYKKDGKESIGFIAQEVQQMYPELVSTDESSKEKYLSLNYAQLNAVLALQINELRREISILKSKLKITD